MDNPQHYQPLSHALNPPSSGSHTRQHYPPQPTTSYATHQPVIQPVQQTQPHTQEEEEEDDEEDDEGLVEEQLNRHDAEIHNSNPSSPKITGPTPVQPSQVQEEHQEQEPERKRRPGRPRGSKNRKPRAEPVKQQSQQPQQQQSYYYQSQPPTVAQPVAPTLAGPPQHPNINPQNQQYYEFQWRVLNLCAEFYGAAEELVKKTPPLVVAQCYHMGPGIKVDPINMLTDAKRVCDTLLANPSQLVTNPPPPMYPVIPTLCQPLTQPAVSASSSNVQNNIAPTASTSTTSPAKSTAPTSVITHPQSFAVPLGTQPAYPSYPVYQAPSYAAPSYYPPYATYPPPGTYYSTPALVAPTAQPQQTPPSASRTTSTVPAATSSAAPGNQGPWSEDEVDRLKKLSEDSRAKHSGEIDWEWVINEWGATRTRHQILLKANSLGLKESASRGTKRRRDEGGSVETSTAPSSTAATPIVPAQQQPGPNPQAMASAPSNTSATGMAPTASPRPAATGTGTPTPGASPALAHVQRPPSAKGLQPHVGSAPPPIIASKMPWPMPTVASTGGPSPQPQHQQMQQQQVQQQQRTDYYQTRPQDGTAVKTPASMPTQLAYSSIYTPNGQLPQKSMRTTENGK